MGKGDRSAKMRRKLAQNRKKRRLKAKLKKAKS